MNKVEELLKELGFEYELEHEEEDGIDIYYTGITTESGINLDMMIILSKKYSTLTLYVPDIVPIPSQIESVIYDILNDINSKTIYGAFFMRKGSSTISYRNAHSLEGDLNGISKNQFEDYLSAIDYTCDELIDEIGKLINDEN